MPRKVAKTSQLMSETDRGKQNKITKFFERISGVEKPKIFHNLSECSVKIEQLSDAVTAKFVHGETPHDFDEVHNIKHEEPAHFVVVIPSQFDEDMPQPIKVKTEFGLRNCSVKVKIVIKSELRDADRHKDLSHKVHWNCKHCSESFRSRRELSIHKRKKHFICDRCGFPSKDETFLKKHICSRKVKSFRCDWCSKLFYNISNINQHVAIHRKETKVKCDFCGKSYVKIRLNQHIRLVHTESQLSFRCDHCCHDAKTKLQLEYHMNVHFKPFQCEVCNKKFSEERYFKEHKLNHDSPNPFGCEKCDKAFTRKTSLSRHMRTAHSSKRNYRCKLCDYRGKTQDDLTIHTKIHSKAFKCDVCARKFSRSTQLKEHRVLHDNALAYQCNVCHGSFSAKKSLKLHKCNKLA